MALALTRRSFRFERVALAGAVVFLGFLVSRYDVCFQDGEVLGFQPAALKQGTAFVWQDVWTAFDVMGLDGDFRPRVLSYLAFTVTVKTRLALWQIVPPHPSFTPFWLLTMGVAPLLFYRFLRLELQDRAAAFAGVAVYLVSAGFLSGVTMLFHPGKPLANVVVIGTFYLCARINAASAPSARLVAALLVLLTLAPFVDETAAFAWIVPFVWCPYCRRRWLVFAAPALLAAVAILLVAPLVFERWFDAEFDLVDYLYRQASAAEWSQGSVSGKVSVYRVVRHAGNLLTTGLLPWHMALTMTPIADLRPVPVLGLSLLAAASAMATRLAWRHERLWPVYRRLAMLAALFFVFQSLVLVFHEIELSATGYYYGAIFSVLFAGLAAVVYAAAGRSPRALIVARLALLWILAISAINFLSINAMWILHSNDKLLATLPAIFPDRAAAEWQALELGMTRPLSGYELDVVLPPDADPAERSWTMWNRWRATPSDFTSGEPLALRDLWLVLELRAIR